MIDHGLGESYSRIGQYVISLAPDVWAPIFLYAEAEPSVMGVGLFQDRPANILYIEPDTKLTDLLFEVWESEDLDKRWSSMEFSVRNGEFSASFTYEKFKDYNPEREYSALRRNFGDKPIFDPGPSFEESYAALDPRNFPGDF